MSRSRILKQTSSVGGNVAYWMQRDQRVADNWALVYAQNEALKRQKPLYVFFNLLPDPFEEFMLDGLNLVEKDLATKNISFVMTKGSPEKNIPELVEKYGVDYLVTDFNPLKSKKQWLNAIMQAIDATICEVDAHNVVPCWEASPKQEYAARTFRPKLKAKLYDYLTEFPEIIEHPYSGQEGLQVMRHFIDHKLNNYAVDRNDPTKDALSNLSPYLHFGQISAQRVVMETLKSNVNSDAFIEEITVRKELSDNFCYYNENYDNFGGFPDWAKKTLNEHRHDPRAYLYTQEELEQAKTHDDLWNAAQLEMIQKGKMHGYMRMYWAKKILEWTPSPEKAMDVAIYLNDKYERDGRDPNGYVGIAWSIGGVHDRAWSERPVFGKIRYMSYGGAKSKFDVTKYIEKYIF